jgi:hypothetical protein
MCKGPFKIIGNCSPNMIEEIIDRFHFKKYKENTFEIPAIIKKDSLRKINDFYSCYTYNPTTIRQYII